MNITVSSQRVGNSIGRFKVATGLLLGALVTTASFGTPLPKNLGNGLREHVQQEQAARQSAATTSAAQTPTITSAGGDKVTDAQGRVLVSVVLNGKVAIADMQRSIVAAGASIHAADSHYRKGIIEAFVSADQAVNIAKMAGVNSVNLVLKPYYNIGKATSQGIVQHRIDKVPNGINGNGITVGVLSDSFNTSGGPIKAGDDVRTGDLPGPANPFGHTQPVVILQDDPGGTDEGRAMLQIVHDIAPDAHLGFATADPSELNFADNIRSLAGLPAGSKSKPNFAADVIIDDVIYYAEPMFQDGVIAQAVDDVAAAGVAYFSSAGNQPASQAYDAPFRLVANTAAATAGTNLNFKNVDPSLYKGGFHNFATDGVVDIAQTIHVPDSSRIVFQWNEPFDATPPALGKLLQSGSGTLTKAMPTKAFPFQGTAGERIGIFADAAGTSNPLPDVTITLLDPQGNVLAVQDDTTDPELLVTFLPVTGTYTIVIGGFEGATGDFIYRVYQASGTANVETDFNLLFFDANGKFLGAIAENNRATNRPIETAGLPPLGDVQLVIARANKPPQGAPVADHLRYVWFGAASLGEWIDYTTPATYGHSCAAGANGVAAYAWFPPFVPESFTSPGPVTIYFDDNNNALANPDRRLRPNLAATDGGNTTFFVSDASQDADTLPNFFGTSAAAPHAGGIAALVLQAAGGPHSLSPNAVRQNLQASAFLHDLDPNHSDATLQNGTQKMVIAAADGDGTNTSSADPNFFTVTYNGAGSLRSLTLDMSNADPTETVKGLVFDTSPTTGFPFTLGNLYGVPRSAITTSFTMPAPPPATSTQYRNLTVSIASGAMTSGETIHFGVDRDEADAFGPNGAVGGNSADLLGAGVLIPQGTIAQGGATVSATTSSGTVLQGVFKNLIGHGWSPLDGYGFINAQAAVQAAQQ